MLSKEYKAKALADLKNISKSELMSALQTIGSKKVKCAPSIDEFIDSEIKRCCREEKNNEFRGN